MLKKSLSFILSCALLCTATPVGAFAANDSDPTFILEELNKKHENVQVELLSESEPLAVSNTENFIEVDSWKELEEIMDTAAELSATSSRSIDIPISSKNPDLVQTYASEWNSSDTISWQDVAWWQYLLVTWETTIWKNVKIDHTYTKNSKNQNEFTNVRDVNSWISGTTVARSWTQQGDATWNIRNRNRTNDEIWASVTGTYLLGVNVSVGGVSLPIGLSTTDTWTCTLYWED